MSDSSNRVRFIAASRGQCRFFLPGESGMNGFVCGNATDTGKSFCPCHQRLTHLPNKPNSRLNSTYFDATVHASEFDDAERDLTELVS